MDNISSSQILVTLMDALSPSETSVLTSATLCNIPEEGILYGYFVFLLFNFQVGIQLLYEFVRPYEE
jgi:hypothetical protein